MSVDEVIASNSLQLEAQTKRKILEVAKANVRMSPGLNAPEQSSPIQGVAAAVDCGR